MAHIQGSLCRSTVSILVFWLLSAQTVFTGILIAEKNIERCCIKSEREALLTFKAGIIDPLKSLASWEGEDCCAWSGVACSNGTTTGHVVELNLRNSNFDLYNESTWVSLSGKISPSLLNLTQLRVLDLSCNTFNGTIIPEFIGSFKNLSHLDLSFTGFVGRIPPQLGNLTRLRYLNFSSPHSRLHVDHDLRWLSRLSSLNYLDMSFVNLATVVDWLHMVNMLPSLRVLRLEVCKLSTIPIALPFLNLTSLITLDLRYNSFYSILPPWLWNISRLTQLNLHFNRFFGPIPDAIGNMTSLEVLGLRKNNIDGMLPRTMRNLCSLNTLRLSDNNLIGELNELVERLPNCSGRKLQILSLGSNKLTGNLSSGFFSIALKIGKLSQLTRLDLSYNSFEGHLSGNHFNSLTELESLEMSGNSVTMHFDETWVPPFQLKYVGLGSCGLGSRFPTWLRWQKNVGELDLSSNGISGTIPSWFWNSMAHILFLNLSNNLISGKLPLSLEIMDRSSTTDLSFNRFEGPIPPSLLSNSKFLFLSNNFFSGEMPQGIQAPYLTFLSLSNNVINSSFPSFLCKEKQLYTLDLSNNQFTGKLPRLWKQSALKYVNLANNKLFGGIPKSLGSLTQLVMLQLSNNSLSGPIPASLQRCRSLRLLDLGFNKLSGNVPTWFAENLTSLSYLRLRSNMFHGNIPPKLARLDSLQVLDFANNNLSGSIPNCFGNFSSMMSTLAGSLFYNRSRVLAKGPESNIIITYSIGLLVVTKGEDLEYTQNLYLEKSMDLSDNNLSGEIPEEIGALIGLINLNLSGNQFSGTIPKKIGGLQSLESLDLSRNELSGEIPPSMSSLNFLSHLNLSYNHLSGKIPSGYQLQTLNDATIYAANFDLCGPPLLKNCSSDEPHDTTPMGDDFEDDKEIVWLYLSIGLGFMTGLWAVFGVLLLKKTWRYACFRFFDKIYDWVYVLVALKLLAKLKNRMTERD